MKLRNKKTGEIGEPRVFYQEIYVDTAEHNTYCYKTIAGLNSEWEDYKPAEPLIKDEKIRKAVRVWADASGITKVLSYGGIFWIGLRSTNTESVWKFECNYIDGSEFQQDKEYTITELCGDEEE